MKKMIKKFGLCAAVAMIAMMMVAGCIEDGPLSADDAGGDDVDNPDSGVPTQDPDACPDDPDASTPSAPTLSVTAAPMTIVAGQSTTVSWVSTNTTSCSSSGGGQPTNGSWLVSPTTTTTYSLSCSGPGGEVSDSVTVTVNPASIVNLTATPTTILLGGSSTVTWTSANTNYCVGTWSFPENHLASNGSVSVSPTTTMLYQVWCDGSNGASDVSASVTVTVNASTPSVCHGLILTFTATDVQNIHHCEGWNEQGQFNHNLTVGTTVTGGEHDCAITCPKNSDASTNVLPASVSGIWDAVVDHEVARWTTLGCKRLPDHPASEPNQAGGTWDKRCDLY